jgi:putative ATP-dependent endonuclease of OLD family
MSVSLGGGTLHHWVNKNYLRKLNKPEVHIYDNDVKKYKAVVDEINGRDGAWACTTKMLELENYIHPVLITSLYPIEENFCKMESGWIEDWKAKDIPKSLSAFLKNLKASGNTKIIGEGQDSIKRMFSEKGAPLMTVELLRELDAYEEVEGWFNKIKEHIS